VQSLQFNHDALEQYTRKFNVEVYDIPECEGENLADIFIKIGQKISVDLSFNDIDICDEEIDEELFQIGRVLLAISSLFSFIRSQFCISIIG